MTVIGLDENDAEELVEGGRWKGRGKGREVASMDPMVEASSDVDLCMHDSEFLAGQQQGWGTRKCRTGDCVVLSRFCAWIRPGEENSNGVDEITSQSRSTSNLERAGAQWEGERGE
jgi:hypothetical protein